MISPVPIPLLSSSRLTALVIRLRVLFFLSHFQKLLSLDQEVLTARIKFIDAALVVIATNTHLLVHDIVENCTPHLKTGDRYQCGGVDREATLRSIANM
jgi:hypothetical protein